MADNVVEIEFLRIKSLSEKMSDDLVLTTNLSQVLPKHLALCASSFMEAEFIRILKAHYDLLLASSPESTVFLEGRLIKKLFYQSFDFKEKDERSFFKSFNPEEPLAKIKSILGEEEYKKNKDAFMEVVHARNALVHNNYASYSFDYTLDEVITLFRDGYKFILGIETFLERLRPK